jgi:hypothetical protein
MPSSEQIRESIDARLSELRSEIGSLEAARAVLETNGASRARSRPASAVRAGKRTPRRRQTSTSAREVTAPAAQAGPSPAATAAAPTSGRSAKPTNRSRRPRGATDGKSTPRGRPVTVLVADTLEGTLRGVEDGLNAVAIAKQAGARDTQVRGLLRELESAGRVRRTGTGRGSRWRLVTDEDRIAERAAELEAVSTAKP